MFLGGLSSMAAPTSEPPATVIWRCSAACTGWAAPGGRRGSCWLTASATWSPSPCCSACWTWVVPNGLGCCGQVGGGRGGKFALGAPGAPHCGDGMAGRAAAAAAIAWAPGGLARGSNEQRRQTCLVAWGVCGLGAAYRVVWCRGSVGLPHSHPPCHDDRCVAGEGGGVCVFGVPEREPSVPPLFDGRAGADVGCRRGLTPPIWVRRVRSGACTGLRLCMPAARVLRSWTWFTLHLAAPIRAGLDKLGCAFAVLH
ncbi:hypothetical protein PLESTB_000344500 [Pleodorina starrii]|uniref:Uncharacterized protein n=1 Tax=Pleodorina starrii TaxID=330485 RepID=A0A9W6BE89_9CHLO|nr:hypothetical protein PLESTB_000344500 [Pleodorina starrii]